MSQSEAAAPGPTRRAGRPRIFYGWWIVLGAIVGEFVASGMYGYVAGVFMRPMSEDLAWTRAQYSTAISVGTVLTGVFGFYIGAQVDRVGARPLMLTGVTIAGGALMATSLVQELWQFVLLRGVVVTIGFAMLGNLVINPTIAKWFVRRRGWAIAIGSLGISGAGFVIPPVMVAIVDNLGWRDAWIVLGVMAWAAVYPVALMMRRQPEDYGLLPDGVVEGDEEDAEAVEQARLDLVNSYTRREALRTRSLWLLVLAYGFMSLGMAGLMPHAIPFLTDAGFARSQAAWLMSSRGAAAFISKFAWGWAIQHYQPRPLAAFSFLLSGGAGLLMLSAARNGSLGLMALSFLIWGCGVGAIMPVGEFLWASFFGRRHLGAVRSAGMPVTILFSAGGPFFAGAWFDLSGSYNGVLITLASMSVVAALLILRARPPAPKETAAVAVPAGEPQRAPPAPAPALMPAPPEPAAEPVATMALAGDAPMASSPLPAQVGEEAAAEEADAGTTADEEQRPERDYMRERIAEPGPGRAGPAREPAPAAPDSNAARSAPEKAPEQAGEEAPALEDAERRRDELPAAAFLPFDEFDEFEDAVELEPQPGTAGESRPAEPHHDGSPQEATVPAAMQWTTVVPSVNLGGASRALQSRRDAALAYYRREGVAPAAWAGVAASVVVSAIVWRMTRNGRSEP